MALCVSLDFAASNSQPSHSTTPLDLNLAHFAALDIKHEPLSSLLEFLRDQRMRPDPSDITPDAFVEADIVAGPSQQGHSSAAQKEDAGDSLCNRTIDGLVNLGPVLLGSIGLDLGPDQLLGPGERATVGVVDNGQLVEVEEAVGDVDVLQRVADVAARVSGD
jgi:hypothetical protein